LLEDRAREVALRLKKSDFVRVITHIDTDGISAGAVAKSALDREGIANEIIFVKSLEPGTIPDLTKDLPENGLIWFCDLGSGSLPELEGIACVITDHHEPRYPTVSVPQEKRGDLLAFTEEVESQETSITQLNPHDFDIEGSNQISGAGVTYLVALEMNKANEDLSIFAVVGAVGDIQTPGNKLIGLNREILDTAVNKGLIKIEEDIAYYGRETRDLVQILSHASEPPIPTLSRNPNKVMDLYKQLGIELKRKDGGNRHWTDLGPEERKNIISALMKLFLYNSDSPGRAKRIIGEVYIIEGEEKGSPLRDAKEFSTLLNSCGRYGHYDVALEICLGERGERLQEGLKLMWDHRANIMRFIEAVKEVGIKKREGFSYFYSEDRIPEEVVGIILGIMMSSGNIDRSKPVFAFADSSEKDLIKVSARAARSLVDGGLDLSKVLKKCTALVKGSGGGHDVAAGGVVPRAALDEFLKVLEEELVGQ
jgi:RecJ-like exonuclease